MRMFYYNETLAFCLLGNRKAMCLLGIGLATSQNQPNRQWQEGPLALQCSFALAQTCVRWLDKEEGEAPIFQCAPAHQIRMKASNNMARG